jgi:hypothetical protein
MWHSLLCSSNKNRDLPVLAFRGVAARAQERALARQNTCHITCGYVASYALGRGGGFTSRGGAAGLVDWLAMLSNFRKIGEMGNG